jgi:hypothetical protein
LTCEPSCFDQRAEIIAALSAFSAHNFSRSSDCARRWLAYFTHHYSAARTARSWLSFGDLDMRQLRRLTAIVLNLLLIQIDLLGHGTTCGQREKATVSVTNAAMAMTGAFDASHATHHACVDLVAAEGCSLPGAPACAVLTSCMSSALPARTSATVADVSPGVHAWVQPALVRQAPRPAPDLPPSRV